MDYNFVSVHLGQAVEIILEDEMIHPDDALDWAMSLLKKGYKLSVSYSEQRDGFVASLTGKEGSANSGLVISQWSGSPQKAVRKLHLIHEVICRGDNWGIASGAIEKIITDALKYVKTS